MEDLAANWFNFGLLVLKDEAMPLLSSENKAVWVIASCELMYWESSYAHSSLP